MLIEYVRSAVALDTRRFADELRDEGIRDREELDDLRYGAEYETQIMKDPDDERRQTTVRSFGKSILTKEGFSPEVQLTADFLEIVRRGILETAQRRLDRLDDRYDRPFHDALFDPAAKRGATVKELADDFLAERIESYEHNNVNQQRRDQLKSYVSVLVELLGPDMPAQAINYDAVKRVRSQLAQLPKNCSKIYPGVPLTLAISKGAEEQRALLASTTQGDYLTTLRDMLQLGWLKGSVDKNYAEGIQPLKRDSVADRDKRKPFEEKQVKAFFTSDFYQSCVPNAAAPYQKKDRDWRFWMQLIMAFAGARPNEIAQLRVRDIKQTEAGVWYFDLANETDESDEALPLQLKTQSSRRRTPIHAELIKMGLLAFVRRRGQEPEGRNTRLWVSVPQPDKLTFTVPLTPAIYGSGMVQHIKPERAWKALRTYLLTEVPDLYGVKTKWSSKGGVNVLMGPRGSTVTIHRWHKGTLHHPWQ